MATIEGLEEQVNKIREQLAGITTQAEALGATTLESQQAVSTEQADANTLAALTGGDTIPSAPTPILGEPPEERLTTAQTTIDTATATGAAAAARATSESEFFKAQQQIFQEQQEQLDKLEKEQGGFIKQFLTRDKVDIQAEREALQQQFQIPELQQQITPLIADIGALNLRIANIEAQRLASLDASGERTGSSLGFQTGEQKRINREFDRRTMAISAQVTAKTATVNMFRGELDSARGQIDNMIQAIMYDTQVARQDTLDYLNFYENEIGSLEADQKAIFNDMKTFWEKETATQEADLNAKRDLQLFAAQNGVVLNWGPADYAKPLSELNSIVASRVGTTIAEGDILSVAEAKALGVPFGTTRSGAFGITPTGTGGAVSSIPGLDVKDEQRFETAINVGTNALAGGKLWGDVWNEIKDAFPSVPNEFIDNALGGGQITGSDEFWGWARAGAFEGEGISNANIAG